MEKVIFMRKNTIKNYCQTIELVDRFISQKFERSIFNYKIILLLFQKFIANFFTANIIN